MILPGRVGHLCIGKPALVRQDLKYCYLSFSVGFKSWQKIGYAIGVAELTGFCEGPDCGRYQHLGL